MQDEQDKQQEQQEQQEPETEHAYRLQTKEVISEHVFGTCVRSMRCHILQIPFEPSMVELVHTVSTEANRTCVSTAARSRHY
jgi:hypothetical protein